MARILQIRFSGGTAVPPDLPPSEGLTATSFQYEVSIFENMAMILEKPIFMGWYPLKNPLQVV